jgi:hypothetical protein
MQADVDMSGRIEETNRPTALALANGVSVSIWISAKDKREAIAALRKLRPERERKFIHVLLFSHVLYLLVRGHIEKLNLIKVDEEYPGYEPVIKNRVLSLCRNEGLKVEADQIAFTRVGKKSPAHTLAYGVFKGNIRPGNILTVEEIIRGF